MMVQPQIIFVPGLRPKPHPSVHHRDLLRCLAAGVTRLDPDLAGELSANPERIEITAWNHPFYNEYYDIELDRDGIEAVIQQAAASSRDRQDAVSPARRFQLRMFQLADYLPFMIPALAPEKVAAHIRDLHRYVRDEDGLGVQTRSLLIEQLHDAARRGRPIMVIGHSMGSVIAYDALWHMAHVDGDAVAVDSLLTIGSPLGQRLIQKHLLGFRESEERRYPQRIRRWVNVSAVGDMTAIDRSVSDDFAAMVEQGCAGSIEDLRCWNFFRNPPVDGELNVHAEYGYLANEVVAGLVAKWWRSLSPQRAGE